MATFETGGPLRQREEFQQKTRVVVMLGARMIDPKGTKEWKFPLFSPNQTNVGTSLPGEVSGGWSRMRAIESEQHNMRKAGAPEKLLVIVTGGRAEDGVPKSKEAADKLVRDYGLPENAVVPLTDVATTRDNATATAEYIRSHKETLGDVRDIEIVTNDYHMLRAWIMFSQGMLKSTANRDPAVSSEDRDTVRKFLDEGLPTAEGWTPARVRETREKIMAVLQPYFTESNIHVVPVVVEETLEENIEEHPAKSRYARMLRNNRWVKEALQFEYQGIKDLLEGKYRNT